MKEETDLAWFRELSTDLVNQWHDYLEFECLFYGTEARVALLNRVAKHFFGELFFAHLDRVVLAVSRLTDPAGSGNRQNLSIWAVHGHYASISSYPSESFGRVATAATIARSHTAKWRNKRIAHPDAKAVLNKTNLGEIRPAVLRDFYEQCGKYVSDLSEALGQGLFPVDTVSQHGAEDLVTWLKRAVATRDAPGFDIAVELEQLSGGEYADA